MFHALADPTRRNVLQRLTGENAAVSELAQAFDMALPSFLQRLDVLEECGLVRSRKAGRVRTYQITTRPLQVAEGWLALQRTRWESRLDQLDQYLLELKSDASKTAALEADYRPSR